MVCEKTIREKVEALRKLMKANDVQAYMVPSTDPHKSEYVPAPWQRRRYISGFTGSVADVVITEQAAGLWADSRYYLQAEDELDSGVYTLFKKGMPGVPEYDEWLAGALAGEAKAGVDPKLLPMKDHKRLKRKLGETGVVLESIEENLVDVVWEDRPPMPGGKVLVHGREFAGEEHGSKLARLREKMGEREAEAHVITTLDALAWLFNLRGSDVEFNPVFVAYGIVTLEKACLFVDENKVSPEVRAHLGDDVELRPYEEFAKSLAELESSSAGVKTWLDPAFCSQWVKERLGPGANVVEADSPVSLFKAMKNGTELEGYRKCHVRDGKALVRFLIWLDESLAAGDEITELGVAKKLGGLRSEGELCIGPSFEPIVGFREHGAVIHYGATPETDMKIEPPGLLLVDSGGQYLDGTTDATRTVALGEPTEEQRDRFTRVLKGYLRLASMHIPEGTRGGQLDSITRLDLWEEGLDFDHGVGHGVGACLNVHEGPVSIFFKRERGARMKAGMVFTIEPGFYREGEYGIRIENQVESVEAQGLSNDETVFLKFEPLTLCPIDLSLVDLGMLTDKEKDRLNRYHNTVRHKLGPHLDADEKAWLAKATRTV